MLVGRQAQFAQIGAVLDRACAGRAGLLRLVGDPGLGKTALLDWAGEQADARGMATTRMVALELEQGLPDAGLDVLLRLLGAPDTRRTPAGLLSALARASADQPLFLAIDDIQWLDARTVAALSFASRRLVADPVAVLLAGRPESDRIPALAAIPGVDVPPLTDEQGVELLRDSAPALSAPVAARVSRSLGGVPLALREAVHLLPGEVLAGREPLPTPIPVGPAIQDRYAQGFQHLDPQSRQGLVLLATAATSDPDVIKAALERAGLGLRVLEPAEEAGLARLAPRPCFVHPLARAAVHSAGRPAELRHANEVLAEVLAQRGDPGGALRHRAAATVPPDAALAVELEDLARQLARHPASRAEAADVTLLAARFTPTPSEQTRLRLLAAHQAGASTALAIVSELEGKHLNPDDRVRCLLIRIEHDDTSTGQGIFRRSTPTSTTYLPALEALEGADLSTPVAHQVENWRAWLAMETLDRPALERAVARLERRRTDPSDWEWSLTLGQALTFLGEHDRAVPQLRAAVERSAGIDPAALPADRLINWAVAPGWLLEVDADHAARFRRMDQILRATGEPENVVSAAFFSSERARREGRWHLADALLREAVDVSRLLGAADMTATARLACLLAYRGRQDEVGALTSSAGSGLGGWSAWNSHWFTQARGALALTLGNPEEAVRVLTPMRGIRFAGRGARDHFVASLVDLVEAQVAIGDTPAAAETTADLATRLNSVVDPFGPAMVARCQALVSPDDAEDLLGMALAHLSRTTEVFETARTQLLLGEQRRRTRRPRDARDPLTDALRAFEDLGAGPWAERARRELAAAGARVNPQAPRTKSALSPQEARIALAVADGNTNAEVASQLFLSVKTVEFHLSSIYRKLGVRSRGGLAKALSAAQGS